MSHRSEEFLHILKETQQRLRDLLHIPSDYQIIFLQGGGTGQFAAVPLNFLANNQEKADYLVTGTWSKKAADEAKKFGLANIAASSEKQKFTRIPPTAEWALNPDAKYLYFCQNETINGVEFHTTPTHAEAVSLVADVSSNFLSRAIKVEDYGLLYAGAQKNAGIAGVTILIIKNALLQKSGTNPAIPTVLHYKQNAAADSTLNTPPTFAIYLSGLVFKWIQGQGGVEEMETRAIKKSSLVYEAIDSSKGFYVNTISKCDRSRMNVVFTLSGGQKLEEKFLAEAADRGFVGLEGHRSVGGIRASLYNAIKVENVESLVQFMKQFHQQNTSV